MIPLPTILFGIQILEKLIQLIQKWKARAEKHAAKKQTRLEAKHDEQAS